MNSQNKQLLDEEKLRILGQMTTELFPSKNYVTFIFQKGEAKWGALISDCERKTIVAGLEQALKKIQIHAEILPDQNN